MTSCRMHNVFRKAMSTFNNPAFLQAAIKGAMGSQTPETPSANAEPSENTEEVEFRQVESG